MSKKPLYYLAALVGSVLGGYIPTLFGASFLSFSSILLSGIVALLAIYIVYKYL